MPKGNDCITRGAGIAMIVLLGRGAGMVLLGSGAGIAMACRMCISVTFINILELTKHEYEVRGM